MEAFLWCSVPLSLILYFASLAIDLCFAERPLWQRYAVTAVAGPCLGFLWTLVARFLMGSAFGAFSFSVYYSWIVGSLFALLFTVFIRFPQSWYIAASLLIVVSGGVAIEAMIRESRPLPPDMVIVFKPDTTPEQILQFGSTIVGRPSSAGYGFELPEIISAAGNSGSEAYIISFWRGTSDSEREQLRNRLQKSPVVAKIIDRPRETDAK